MLEKPNLQEQKIISHLQTEYRLPVTQVTFLPLGADINTAVYRAITQDKTPYFLKLRRGAFNEATVTIPQFLKTQGIQAIIAPLETENRQLWTEFGEYKMILYPFIEGKDGYQAALSNQQWVDFGAALKNVHTAPAAPGIWDRLPREDYSPRWRESVKVFQEQAENTFFSDQSAAKFAAVIRARRNEISHIVERAGALAQMLRTRPLELVLCHSDIHPGNLLLSMNEALYIVDWDTPTLAPKERDLMFIGIGGIWRSESQAKLFYQGYGRVQVDLMALAYYRYERIVQDLAAFGEQLLLTTTGGEDRERALEYFSGQFEPGNEIEVAYLTDQYYVRSSLA